MSEHVKIRNAFAAVAVVGFCVGVVVGNRGTAPSIPRDIQKAYNAGAPFSKQQEQTLREIGEETLCATMAAQERRAKRMVPDPMVEPKANCAEKIYGNTSGGWPPPEV